MTTTLSVIALVSLFILYIILKLNKLIVYDKQIVDSPSPYGVDLVNNENEKKSAVLFGMNSYLLTPNFGSSLGVNVTPAQQNVSYLNLLQESCSHPFIIKTLRVKSTLSQLEDKGIILITSKDAKGQECCIPLIINNYISSEIHAEEDKSKEFEIDIPFKISIDGNTELSFELLPNSKMSVTMFYGREKYITKNFFKYIFELISKKFSKDDKPKFGLPYDSTKNVFGLNNYAAANS